MFVAIFKYLVYNESVMIRLATKADEYFIAKKLKKNPYMRVLHEAEVGTAYVSADAVLILVGTTLHSSEYTVSSDIHAFARLMADKICRPSRSGHIFAARRCEGESVKAGFDQASVAYKILSACGEIEGVEFDRFYVNIQKRLSEEKIHIAIEGDASVVMTFAETFSAAYISGVATLPEYRGKGYASKAMNSLCAMLRHKTAYILYDKKLNKFYKSLGFEKVRYYKIEDVKR